MLFVVIAIKLKEISDPVDYTGVSATNKLAPATV